MRSGHLPTRPYRLAAVTLGLGLGLSLLSGCYRDQYDESLIYPVRTDWVVNPNNNWEQQPTGFNHPGILPLDALRMPEKEQPPDVQKLHQEIGKKIYDPTELGADVRAEYGKALLDMFGTPAHPKVSGFDPAALKAAEDSLTADQVVNDLKLDEATLAEGSKLYRQQCLHCHGLEGNGRGPTGYWVNPPPRDYRQGIFKYTSSNQDQNLRKPRREDLLRVLTAGIEGTSMPSFGVLPREDLEKIASYVIHLSLRGEAEYATMLDQLKDPNKKVVMVLRADLPDPSVRKALEDNLALAAARWVAAQKADAAIKPDGYPYPDTEEAFVESAARGAKIFIGTGGCISCHQNFGRESNLTYDSWGTIVRGRNLYDGIYRGGRRPLDLYYRVYGGINGAGMTSYKDLKDKMKDLFGENKLKPADVGLTSAEQLGGIDPLWDLVNFLKAAAFPDLRARLRDQYKVTSLPEF
jgi:mono/diheme cytochrome c family protein